MMTLVGRSCEIEQLLGKFVARGESIQLRQLTALEGLGGVGKTQIALEAAFQVYDRYSDSSVFWVSAADHNSFENSFRKIGQDPKVAGIDEDKADIKTLVKAKLCQ